MSASIAYTLFGATLSALSAAALFVVYLKWTARRKEAGWRESCALLSEEVGVVRQQYDALRAELRSSDTAIAATPSEYSVRPSLNLAKRTGILRHHRRGESAEGIATALQIPRSEVDLVLKIHQIGLQMVVPAKEPV